MGNLWDEALGNRLYLIVAGLAVAGVSHLLEVSSALVGLVFPGTLFSLFTAGGVLLTALGLVTVASGLVRGHRASTGREKAIEGKTSADIDRSTGLWNQRDLGHLLQAECARAIRYGSDLAVLLIDVDDFKQINDSDGLAVGDEVIRQLGCVIRRLVRDVDSVCRYGGAEFCILLPETDIDGAMRLAQRIRGEILSGAMFFGPLSAHLTVSIGAYSPTSSDEIDTVNVLRCAESALKEAKAAGKNRVVACQSIDASHAGAADRSLQPTRAL